MANNDQWRIATHQRDELGEGPVWIAREGALYWVDVLGQAVNRLVLSSHALSRWSLAEPVGFVLPCCDNTSLIAGLKSGIHRLRLEPLATELLCAPEPDMPENRLNDGKVDAMGRVWAGTMPMSADRADGALYRIDSDHSCHRMDSGYHVTNGPAFSPAQDLLYHTDSPARTIYRFAFDVATGTLGERETFIQFSDDDWGVPDGMTIDREGFLWVAHWDGGRVSRFDPDGIQDRMIKLPASRITSCAFGGENWDRLFVTSARMDRHDEPLAGALFELATDCRGLPPGQFAG